MPGDVRPTESCTRVWDSSSQRHPALCLDLGTLLVSDSPDNDDDGETAAGRGLAHLLQIMVSASTESSN